MAAEIPRDGLGGWWAVPRNRVRALVLGGACAVLAGCASAQAPDVEELATAFEDPSGDPQARCDLLIPTALAAFEESEGAPCAEAIEDLPLEGGSVESTEIWGGDAQVKIGGDTVFLSETKAGWRVTAAACTPQGEKPYDCEVEP
jgi:hypothetical protein